MLELKVVFDTNVIFVESDTNLLRNEIVEVIRSTRIFRGLLLLGICRDSRYGKILSDV